MGATPVVGACSVRTGRSGDPAVLLQRASRFGFVGAPVAGAIWGGAFGRAGHAVRTAGGAPTGDDAWVVGAPAPAAKAGWLTSSFWLGYFICRQRFASPPRPVYLFAFSCADQRRQIRWAIGLLWAVFVLRQVMLRLGQAPALQW